MKDMEELVSIAGGTTVATNQVPYNLTGAVSSGTCCLGANGKTFP
jgi:hypothetical protein